ncbi:hypothetical protein SAMD00023353_0100040 [Rosellinia necatrix]|uniref:Uncharacterized protein n=1 Tax=Rosellinia necatrix TaxID=77044 RepID=A0A1S8A4M6_ROSNE|nr:hypothetical protein SAMD00023353_0100040 [Rosellinia necatrix]
MAKFLASLLAAAALLQVGIAAPHPPTYPPTNATILDVKARHYNLTLLPDIHRREIRTYPIALNRP